MSSGRKAYFVLLAIMLFILAIFAWKGRNLNSRTHSMLDRINAELDHLRPPDPTSDEALLKRVNARAATLANGASGASGAEQTQVAGAGAAAAMETTPAGAASPAAAAGASGAADGLAAGSSGASGGAPSDGPAKGGIGEAIQKIRQNRASQDQKLEDAARQ